MQQFSEVTMVYTITKNNKALHIATVLLALGVISFIISTQFPFVPYLFQLAAIILLTFGIQTLQRYHLSDFKYIIDDKDDGRSFFNVIKTQGKKETMICSIDLCRCVYFGKPDNYKEKTVNSFDYRQNIGTKNYYVIIYNDYSGFVTVRIEANDTFAKELDIRIGSNEKTK